MNLQEAKSLALKLMKEHKLCDGSNIEGHGWKFRFDRAKCRFGYCNYSDQIISLSEHLVELNDEKHVRNTILHEIAHALAPRGAGHSKVWKAQALAIGCTAMRCYSHEVESPKANYYAICPNCERRIERFKKIRIACGECCKKYNRGRFDSQYLFVYHTI